MGVATLRILFWNHLFAPHLGGVEIFTERLADGLLALGHEVAVIATRHAPDLPAEARMGGVEVFRFDFDQAFLSPSPQTRLRAVAQLTGAVADLKRRWRPDLVHLNLSDASPFFHRRTEAAWPAPTLVTLQSALLRPSNGPESVTGAILGAARQVVAVSQAAARNIAQMTTLPLDQIAVIAPGVPAAAFWPGASKADDAGPATIAFIGRLAPEKGCDMLIRALAALQSEARLVVIGEGPEQPALESLAAELGLADRAAFAGRVDDATRARLLSEADILAAPSQHLELFGMVAVEGMLSGLPVVASATGGLQEIVVHGETGFLVAVGDQTGWSCALGQLLASRERRRAMGEAGRRRALQHFTAETMVGQYAKLYDDLVGMRAPELVR